MGVANNLLSSVVQACSCNENTGVLCRQKLLHCFRCSLLYVSGKGRRRRGRVKGRAEGGGEGDGELGEREGERGEGRCERGISTTKKMKM